MCRRNQANALPCGTRNQTGINCLARSRVSGRGPTDVPRPTPRPRPPILRPKSVYAARSTRKTVLPGLHDPRDRPAAATPCGFNSHSPRQGRSMLGGTNSAMVINSLGAGGVTEAAHQLLRRIPPSGGARRLYVLKSLAPAATPIVCTPSAPMAPSPSAPAQRQDREHRAPCLLAGTGTHRPPPHPFLPPQPLCPPGRRPPPRQRPAPPRPLPQPVRRQMAGWQRRTAARAAIGERDRCHDCRF